MMDRRLIAVGRIRAGKSRRANRCGFLAGRLLHRTIGRDRDGCCGRPGGAERDGGLGVGVDGDRSTEFGRDQLSNERNP